MVIYVRADTIFESVIIALTVSRNLVCTNYLQNNLNYSYFIATGKKAENTNLTFPDSKRHKLCGLPLSTRVTLKQSDRHQSKLSYNTSVHEETGGAVS